MATYYLDYEGGNDANNGTSFAQRWKTITSGATAARIAPGDTIRVMGSPAPTSLGVNATFTSGSTENNVGIDSSTNTTPIVITTTAAHSFNNGDLVYVEFYPDHTNAQGMWVVANKTSTTFELQGSVGNGTGTTSSVRLVNSQIITLSSVLTKNIASQANPGTVGGGRVVWTPTSGNVTTSLSRGMPWMDYVEVNSSFGTGLAAYFNTGTLNLSAYQGVSLFILFSWLENDYVANDIEFTLCTGTNGSTAVHHIPVPVLNTNFLPLYWDNGSNLNAAIQSIGLNILVDRGAIGFTFYGIIAVKAAGSDNLNCQSLIGKNTAGENWIPIGNIDDTRIIIYSGGYCGTSETVAAYKRETIKTGRALGYQAVLEHTVQDSGTAGNLISFEGGWDRTNMTTQNLETWFDGLDRYAAHGLAIDTKNFISVNKINFVRYTGGVGLANSDDCAFPLLYVVGCEYGMSVGTCKRLTLGALYISLNIYGNVSITSPDPYGSSFTLTSLVTFGGGRGLGLNWGCEGSVVTSLVAGNQYGPLVIDSNGVYVASAVISGGGWDDADNGRIAGSYNSIGTLVSKDGRGIYAGAPSYVIYGAFNRVGSFTATGNRNAGLALGKNSFVYGGSSTGNGYGFTSHYQGLEGYVRNFTVNEASEVTLSLRDIIYLENHDGTVGNHKIFSSGGLISSTTAQRHTASGIAWAFTPLDTSVTSYTPLWLSLAKVPCNASALVTVKAWMRRTNTGLTMRLVCMGLQLNGVGTYSTDVVASMTAAADTWEELTITFTPTEAGVVEITAEAYGGTTYTGYVDDVTISQA